MTNSCYFSLRGSVYISYSADLETASNLCGEAPLGPTEDNIEELGGVWHRSNIFPRSLHLKLECKSR
jgi:hypothetical protein